MGVFHTCRTLEEDKFFSLGIVFELDALVSDASSVGSHLHCDNSRLRLEFFKTEDKRLGFCRDERLALVFEYELGILCAVLHLALEYHAILRITAHIIDALREVGYLDVGVVTRKLREPCLVAHTVNNEFVAVRAFD